MDLLLHSTLSSCPSGILSKHIISFLGFKQILHLSQQVNATYFITFLAQLFDEQVQNSLYLL